MNDRQIARGPNGDGANDDSIPVSPFLAKKSTGTRQRPRGLAGIGGEMGRGIVVVLRIVHPA